MTWHSTIQVIVLCTSLLLTFGLYDQVIKIWRTRSAKDFTFSLIITLVTNELAWLTYGITLREWPMMVISGLNFPATIVGLIGYLRYGYRK